jgi:phosphotriesterase-related protein
VTPAGAGTVQTARGPVAVSALGRTLTHEHLVVGWLGWQLAPDNRGARTRAVERCVQVAQRLVAQGIATIIDPCPADLGRDAELAAEVSERTGLQVVLATGLYTEAAGIPTYLRSMSVDELCAFFVTELEDGIGTTGIRAGVIKCAAGPLGAPADGTTGLAPAEERVLRAAARASAITGAPVVAHNDERRPAGRLQAHVMLEEGADPRHLVVGHADGVGDLRYYLKVLATGARLAFDRFGLDSATSDQQRVAAVAGLAAVGHGDQLLVSTDAAMAWLGSPGPDLAVALSACGHWVATHIIERVVPALRAAGVSDDAIDGILTANPAALFTGSAH